MGLTYFGFSVLRWHTQIPEICESIYDKHFAYPPLPHSRQSSPKERLFKDSSGRLSSPCQKSQSPECARTSCSYSITPTTRRSGTSLRPSNSRLVSRTMTRSVTSVCTSGVNHTWSPLLMTPQLWYRPPSSGSPPWDGPLHSRRPARYRPS